MTLGEYVAQQQHRVDETLQRWVPPESTPPESIHKAMRYSLFAGGKRIRPILCIAAAEAVSDAPAGIESAACTLELIHTYSLIHDDLPALDNDDLRRGMPTCHKVFGEAMAILAGDALLTLAFQVLAQMECEPSRKTRLIAELAVAAGTVGGMIGGQVNDIEGERKHPSASLLEAIHRAKTGALLRASVKMGGIYAGADSDHPQPRGRRPAGRGALTQHRALPDHAGRRPGDRGPGDRPPRAPGGVRSRRLHLQRSADRGGAAPAPGPPDAGA